MVLRDAKGCQSPEVESIVIWFGFVVVLGLFDWLVYLFWLAEVPATVSIPRSIDELQAPPGAAGGE